MRELAGIVREFPGESPVIVALDTSPARSARARARLPRQPAADFFAEVKALLGEAAVG